MHYICEFSIAISAHLSTGPPAQAHGGPPGAASPTYDAGVQFWTSRGLAVLDVLDDERLMDNARAVGDRLLAGLRDLQRRHEIIGDVRGSGLFLGVELVKDRGTLEPASQAASRIKNFLRDRRVLIGTDGPHDNVLKIRPPMTFDAEAADCLLESLERALASR